MSEPVSSAQYFPWDGGAVFVGTAGVFPVHAHQAIQICFLFEGRIRLRARDDEPWADYDLGLVPSQHAHGMDGARTHYGATLFVEPETREGRILTERYLRAGITNVDRAPVASIVRELQAAVLEQRGRPAIVALARRIVQCLTQHSEPSVTSDERILRAVKYVNEHLAAPLTLKQVASVAHLSPSRFRHLFVAQTGVSFRAYVLWARVGAAVGAAMNGQSWTAAAQEAGFTDSAHLSRTCRRMFGIAPATLVEEQIPSAR